MSSFFSRYLRDVRFSRRTCAVYWVFDVFQNVRTLRNNYGVPYKIKRVFRSSTSINVHWTIVKHDDDLINCRSTRYGKNKARGSLFFASYKKKRWNLNSGRVVGFHRYRICFTFSDKKCYHLLLNPFNNRWTNNENTLTVSDFGVR